MSLPVSFFVLAALAAPAASADVPLPASPPPLAAAPVAELPAGTALLVATTEDISSQTVKAGDRFGIVVAEDVMAAGRVAIAKGTGGHGEITFASKKGGFGRSGILMIAVRALEIGGQPLALEGHYREEGGNGANAAAATMFAVGILAGAVTGKAGTIPAGRVLKAHTGAALRLAPDSTVPPANAPAGETPVAAHS